MFSKDDDDTGIALGIVFALIVLVVGSVIGFGIHSASDAPAPATAAAAPAEVLPVTVIEDVAVVKVENGIVKFYFATAKADLAIGANEALAEIVKGVQGGKLAAVSGFHDATGDMALNAELAKQRAFAVRDALKALGVAEEKIDLKKPEQMTASGTNAEARRVEVTLQ